VVVILPKSLDQLLALQSNVVTHSQAVERGKSRHEIATLARNGRWQLLHRGVYYALPGPVPREAQLWGAIRKIGHGAVLSHETAAEVWEITDQESDVIHVSVPRKTGPVTAATGVRVHYSARLPRAEFPAAIAERMPLVTWAAETVLDLASASATAEEAVAWAIRACQRRKATPEIIAMFMSEPGHRRLRWRDDLRDALAEIRAGVESPLERRYLRDVEQAHRLPEGRRQVKTKRGSMVAFHDVRYVDYGVGVELDGVAYHPVHARHRDDVRDNTSTLEGVRTLRYGWSKVAYHPCEVAHEVWSLLVRCGYRGDFQHCGPACAAPPDRAGEGLTLLPGIAVRLAGRHQAGDRRPDGGQSRVRLYLQRHVRGGAGRDGQPEVDHAPAEDPQRRDTPGDAESD
jgi:hypothetical protein